MSIASKHFGSRGDDAGDDIKNVSLAYKLSGGAAADAAQEAAELQNEASLAGINLTRETRDLARGDLAPFRQFGEDVLPSLASLFTPEGQLAFFKDSPLFDASLDNLNRQTMNSNAARGRLGSGDTLNSLFNNYLLAGQPLLNNQINSLFNAANLGQASAAGQANTALSTNNSITDLITGAANANAAGAVGAANAQQQGASNAAGIGALLFSAFSDRRLKRNARQTGTHKGYPIYEYQYVWSDDWYRGVMSDDVKRLNPGAVFTVHGYDAVDYGAL